MIQLTDDQVKALILITAMQHPSTPEGQLAARLLGGDEVTEEHVKTLIEFADRCCAV